MILALGGAKKGAQLPQVPYWPMSVGNKWVYQFDGNPAGQEISTTITVEVTGRKTMGGLTYWLIAGYPGKMGPFEQGVYRVRWNPGTKSYLYRTPNAEEIPFLPMDPDSAKTTRIKSGNMGGWDLAGGLKYEVCRDCDEMGTDEWVLMEGLGVISRRWEQPDGSWGRYILQSAVVSTIPKHPGVTVGNLNLEVRANPDAEKVRFELILRNLGLENENLTFPSGQTHDFLVYNADRSMVLWQWAAGKFFPQNVRKVTLYPGQEITVEESWNYTRPDGRVVPPGFLFVEGYLPLLGQNLRTGTLPFDGGLEANALFSSAMSEEILGTPALELVVDMSASMAYEMGGQAKWGVVRRGVEDLLQDLPEESLFSLRTFGSDSTPDCEHTHLIHPLGRLNRYKALSDFLLEVPGDESAVWRALASAGLDLNAHDGPSAIFLVTDGADSCGQGSALESLLGSFASGGEERIRLEVFGYGLSAKLQAAYRKLAISTGGSFHPFLSGLDLSRSLEETARTFLEGGEILVMSEERDGDALLVLDPYGAIRGKGVVGKPIALPEGSYDVRLVGGVPQHLPSILVSARHRRILFLEAFLAELSAMEGLGDVDLDCLYSPDMGGTPPPCWQQNEGKSQEGSGLIR